MNLQALVKTNKIYNSFIPWDLEGVDSLVELALDLRCAWNHSTDTVWEQLDHQLWALTANPWVVLRTAGREKLEKLLAQPAFRKTVEDLVQAKRLEATSPAWFQNHYPNSSLTHVAYFSMEFMLSEALPIYSGGLGNVAGDQLKAASDLGVPVIAIGLLYQQGYFRQMIDKEGSQQALYPYNDPGQLPITPLRTADGQWLRLEVAYPGYSLYLRAWQAQVGRVKLYLLDSNDAANFPIHRGITSELYGGNPELRLKQEMLLGIGGWRLLEALDIHPEVCHLNEGHAALAILERASSFMKTSGQPFDVALEATRAGNLFTTHTAVAAGFDRFSPGLIEQYLTNYATSKLGITIHDLLALGRQNSNDPSEYFNMAYLAMRGSGAINAVSRLHAAVSRHIFEPIYPRWPDDEIPVGYVTNGVHMPSWESPQANRLWREFCGTDRWLGDTAKMDKQVLCIPVEKIWQMRNESRKLLVEFARMRLAGQLMARGATTEEIEGAKHIFNPQALTLGFARRFATYKRPNLLLHDRERLLKILTNPNRPVQLIIAGKAHPADKPGQELILEWMKFIKTPEVRPHIIFLSDYDMMLTQQLVQGVDVWINTPRRPWEACGTSGMKVLVNGGLNLSELDGWWAEAYSPEIGWALGDGQEHGDDSIWDASEANALYDLLEHEVIPEFYDRDKEGIPLEWIKRIKASMSTLTPRYSANRAVREYTEKYYLPSAKNYEQRAADRGAISKQILDWKHSIDKDWSGLRFGSIKVNSVGGWHEFEVQVYLNNLDPQMIKVEIYANKLDDISSMHQEMKLLRKDGSSYIYLASVPANRPAADYTPQIIPYMPGVSIPLESPQILWQH